LHSDRLNIQGVASNDGHFIAANVREPSLRRKHDNGYGHAFRRENSPLIAWHLDRRAHSNSFESLNPESARLIDENSTNRGTICGKEFWGEVLRERCWRKRSPRDECDSLLAYPIDLFCGERFVAGGPPNFACRCKCSIEVPDPEFVARPKVDAII
jgi:hypothetical protein